MNLMQAAAAVVLAAGAAAPGFAQTHSARETVCLTASHISSTTVVSDQVILFHMNDGTVWKNTLRRACPGLEFENAFSEEIRGGEICSNAQMIHVLRRGTPCFLGAFTRQGAPTATPAK